MDPFVIPGTFGVRLLPETTQPLVTAVVPILRPCAVSGGGGFRASAHLLIIRNLSVLSPERVRAKIVGGADHIP